MITVVTMFSAPTATSTGRIARLPNRLMMNVASGGPATQAKETTARVFSTSWVVDPECRSSAYMSVSPTPAGPPSTTSATTATGSVVAMNSTIARSSVRIAHPSMGKR